MIDTQTQEPQIDAYNSLASVKKRAGALSREMKNWSPTWQEIRDYIYPTRGIFNSTMPNQGSKIDHKKLVDEEATLAVDTFAAGMENGFTSSSRPWFRLYIADEELMAIASVKNWLQDVQETMYEIMHVSNTYSGLNSMYTELAPFGTACAIVEEDFNTVIHITNFTIGEYAVSRDRNGRVNGFYRQYWLKAPDLVEQFGYDKVSDKVKIAYQQNDHQSWFSVNHVIETNLTRKVGLTDNKNMPYVSYYWEDGNADDFLKISGYEENPLLCPRFEFSNSTDAYGKGPGWKALGAVKELQKKKKNLLIGLDKGTNPPLVKDSSVVGNVNTLPGGVTTSSSNLPNAGVRSAYEVRLELAALDASIEKTKDTIRKFFFADLFLMMLSDTRQGAPVTATEIVEKQSERVTKIAPLLERWQGDEFIKTFLDRVYAIALRQGLFPEAPAEIADREIKIQYTSVLSQAQKLAEIQGMDAWVNGIIMDANVDPSQLDLINFDERNRAKAEMLGVPPKQVNSIAEVQAKRQQRAAELEAAQKNEQMMQTAIAADKGASAAKKLADSPTGTGSVLDKTMARAMEQAKQ